MTHPCPLVAGLSRPSSVLQIDRSWCFDAWRDRVAELDPDRSEKAWPPMGWTLWSEGPLSVVYTPMDWVNTDAKLALIGISPGRHQAASAARVAGEAIRQGATEQDALRQADRIASFSGPMRSNLVEMLDAVGLPGALGLRSCGELFGGAHDLVSLLSATGYPVFVNGRNHTGVGLDRSPALQDLVKVMLGGDLALTPASTLLIPLGVAATRAVRSLVPDGDRPCLVGIPHPSGANGHRARLLRERLGALQAQVDRWTHGDLADHACQS